MLIIGIFWSITAIDLIIRVWFPLIHLLVFLLKHKAAHNTQQRPFKILEDQQGRDGSGLEMYDFGARFYDAQIGRFHTQDRFAEKLYSLNPYQYCANNPIFFADVNGDSLIVVTTGNQTAIDKFKNLSNESMGGFYNTNVDKDGNVTLEKSDKKGR